MLYIVLKANETKKLFLEKITYGRTRFKSSFTRSHGVGLHNERVGSQFHEVCLGEVNRLKN